MDVNDDQDSAVSRIASAVGELARARILYSLMDGHARTSTELAVVADVCPSTASVHLNRLRTERLIQVQVQGKHRYYSLEGPKVAKLLEALSVLAGGSRHPFGTGTPRGLRAARTCYDHVAGALGVALLERFETLAWLSGRSTSGDRAYDLTPSGAKEFEALRIDIEATQRLRRRFAYACLDWSERRPHVGGGLGAAVLKMALKRNWVTPDLDSRALDVTRLGRREMLTRFGLRV